MSWARRLARPREDERREGVGWLEKKKGKGFPFMNYISRNLGEIQKSSRRILLRIRALRTSNKLKPKTNSRIEAHSYKQFYMKCTNLLVNSPRFT